MMYYVLIKLWGMNEFKAVAGVAHDMAGVQALLTRDAQRHAFDHDGTCILTNVPQEHDDYLQWEMDGTETYYRCFKWGTEC